MQKEKNSLAIFKCSSVDYMQDYMQEASDHEVMKVSAKKQNVEKGDDEVIGILQ